MGSRRSSFVDEQVAVEERVDPSHLFVAEGHGQAREGARRGPHLGAVEGESRATASTPAPAWPGRPAAGRAPAPRPATRRTRATRARAGPGGHAGSRASAPCPRDPGARSRARDAARRASSRGAAARPGGSGSAGALGALRKASVRTSPPSTIRRRWFGGTSARVWRQPLGHSMGRLRPSGSCRGRTAAPSNAPR